ncbi:voltage-gated potassium channel beta-2 subunit [Uncinocarpus reesii 1704]|uniref:Voltage-gated potassium channel beta-2 subunit n=1 Tax=Uncinocarpus reesii (strain UAMH 1704) TaxID=336963 RepID=C4JXU7_UNCRE|nr:voltage-gated potassium channel beta-2 subunit [Uncinocarpus reesii 1704]EEP83020.1 voltage-gated potassium channel beta-2 subunit [Uncinocarpus reesii 1704]
MRCMKQAYDLGVNFFDASEKYSTGQLEIVLGRAVKRFRWKRSELVTYGAVGEGLAINSQSLSRKHIVEATLASLKRLDLEYVDIICAHRPDRLTPMEETVRAFNYLIEKGLAFYWGTSMWSADEITEACRIAKCLGLVAPIVEQPVYNLLDRHRVEGEYQHIYARCGIGLVVTSPLKTGILTGGCNYPNGARLADPQGGAKILNSKNVSHLHESMAYLRKVERLQVGVTQTPGIPACAEKNPANSPFWIDLESGYHTWHWHGV